MKVLNLNNGPVHILMLLVANFSISLNSNTFCYKIFRNFSMIFMNENSLIFKPMNLTILSQLAGLNSVHILILHGS